MVRTKRSAYAFKFGDRGGNLTDSIPASASVRRNWVVYRNLDRGSDSACRQKAHPSHPSDSVQSDSSTIRWLSWQCRRFRRVALLHKEEDHEARQTGTRPHFDGEEIARDQLIPMSIEKLFPGRLTISFGCRLDAMPFQDIRDCRVRQNMAEVYHCTLNPPITLRAIFLSDTNNEFRNLSHTLRPPRLSICAPIIFSRDQFFDATPTMSQV
jgi:hypothetical protein